MRSIKKSFLTVLQYSQKNTCVGVSFFNKVVGLKACNFIKKRLQHRCFPVIIANFLRTAFLKNNCERLLLYIIIFFLTLTLRKKCPYSEFSGPYFPAFGLNTGRYYSPAFELNTERYSRSLSGSNNINDYGTLN